MQDNKKKSMLFLIGSLDSGGVSKSMVSLLNTIDRKKHDVFLWIGNPSGLFYELLPKDIHQLSDKRITLLLKGVNGLSQLLRHGYLLLFLGSLLRLVVSAFNKAYAGWLLAKLMPNICKGKEFDLIVDYNGQQQLYYMVDKLKGKKKITFFHSDYEKWPYYYRMDKKYFPKVDTIFSISKLCVESLKKCFPDQKGKIQLMENISSVDLINKLADEFEVHFDEGYSILSLGHICKNKGTDLAIETMCILREKNIKFKWYFIGAIQEDFSSLIAKYSLKPNIEFLGVKVNPYPYIKACDIFAHLSRYEGKSMALDEAKILCKPIVVTNFSTVKDQFEDRVNALITPFSPDDIALNIQLLLNDEILRKYLIKNLKSKISDNSNEINKLYSFL